MEHSVYSEFSSVKTLMVRTSQGVFFSPVQIRIDDTKRIVANDMGHDLLSRLQNLENLQTDYKKQLDKHIREIAELQQRILPLCVLRAKILDDAAKYTWKDSRYLTRRNGVAHGGNISETHPKGI
jgi:hypothetical protein